MKRTTAPALLLLTSTLCAALFLCGSAAAASLGFKSFEASLSTPLAGAHPDLRTTLEVAVDAENQPVGGTVKDLSFELPEGLVGAANATPTCPINRVLDYENPCPLETAVGKAVATVVVPPLSGKTTITTLVYNVTPLPGEPAAFAFNALFPVRLDVSVRSGGDYGMTVTASNLTEQAHVIATDLTLWGVPADHNGPGPETEAFGRSFGGPGSGPRRPLLTNPTRCSGEALSATVAIDSWQEPGAFSSDEAALPPISGCEELSIEPGLELEPSTRAAATPAGFAVDLTLPQNPDPAGRATPSLRRATFHLPEGLTVSPAAADGLAACADAQLGIGRESAAECPDASRVGSASLSTPLLGEPLEGAIYLGSQLSDDPRSGRMIRLFLVASGAGVTVKLAGAVSVDPATGRLAIAFADLPQLPFDAMRLRFNPGPRALLSTPPECGLHTTSAELLPWSADAATESQSSFRISTACERSRFSPSLEAGALRSAAGASSPFALAIGGLDGGENLARFQVTLPEGVSAVLAGVPLCREIQAKLDECSAASRIGSAVVAIGPGPAPLYLPQAGEPPADIHLAGPYAGAPFSALVDLPARAGPFQLGTVTVRSALDIDPRSGRVTLRSDPLPQILRGVPISYRGVHLRIDRPGFVVNPTSCRAMKVASRLTSVAGATASPSDRFQARGCRSLPFRPRLSLRLGGGTGRTARPSLSAALRLRRGDANLAGAAITLPASELLAGTQVRRICSTARFGAGRCPRGSVYGRAEVWTPLLDRPLTGDVYLRASRHRLPDLVASLDGQARLDLVGRIDAVDARIRIGFPDLPDLPVTRIALRLDGGRQGLLVNNTDLCQGAPRANAILRAHSGRTRALTPVVSRGC